MRNIRTAVACLLLAAFAATCTQSESGDGTGELSSTADASTSASTTSRVEPDEATPETEPDSSVNEPSEAASETPNQADTQQADTRPSVDEDPTCDGDCADPATPAAVVSDAEPELKFDVGILISFDQSSVLFDRAQLYGSDDSTDESLLASGTQFTTEPVIGGITDFPFVNENPKLRTYPLAPTLDVLDVDPAWVENDVFCGGGDENVPPVWIPGDLSELVGQYVTLTFDDSGTVTRIRHAHGC